MKKALVVIDMQIMPFIWKNYGGKPLYREQELVKNVNHLIEKARAADAPIIHILYTETGDSPRAEGQPLWQIHPEIASQGKDDMIVKYHADSFFRTPLKSLLSGQGIQDIVLCGVQTEFCVDTTCRSAHAHGFTVELAADGHSTFDSDLLPAETIVAHHNTILSQFAQVKPIAEINMMPHLMKCSGVPSCPEK